MTLYEIDAAILDLVDEETGEVIDLDALAMLEMERDTKISNVACWIKDLKAEAEAIKAEKMSLAKRQATCENKVEQLKKFLAEALGGAKFKDSRCSISYRKSESVQLDDMAIFKLPDEFVKIEKSPRLTEIKNAIKEGQSFEGVKLVTNNNIQIR